MLGSPVHTRDVEWKGSELLHQLTLGSERVGALRNRLREVKDEVSRIKDNSELLENQRRVIEGQREAILGVKQMALRVQSDNEAMRVDNAKIKQLREDSVRQKADSSALEARHRKELEAHSEVIASVKSDLLALSAENASLRKVQQEMTSLQQALSDLKRQKEIDAVDFHKKFTNMEAEHMRRMSEMEDQHKKTSKEARFKLLRAQQHQTSLEAQLSEAIEELGTLRETVKEAQVATSRPDLSEELQEATSTIRQQDEEIRKLTKKLEALESEGVMKSLELSKKEVSLQEEHCVLVRQTEAMQAEMNKLKKQVKESGERADALAAKLAVAEASLLAKDELLTTRTERLRIMNSTATSSSSPTERENQLMEQLRSLKSKYTTLETTAKKKLDKAHRDRKTLEAKVEELKAKIEDFPD
eukprot:TRINITY_DN2942_c0_g2_i1.p2 TRINITY_DN2942_c0_g2~~TRINITY_DN2942_c0_g2_i1.p2  ORF type:complete len:416 (+),score=136.39 TRINITY_DN2942_c0_g2_i1:45-1292(+)